MGQRTGSKITIFLLVLFAFGVRMAPWFVSDGPFIFSQADAYYHLRRAMIWAHNLPRLISIDYYMAYPFGAECPWPPLYDLTVAVLSRAAGMGKVIPGIFVAVNAFLPVLFGALCTIPVYRIAKLIFSDDRTAVCSALLFAVLPHSLPASQVKSGDHHIFEIFFALWFYYYILRAQRSAAERHSIVPDSVKAGVALMLGMLVWQGEILFYTPWLLYSAAVIILSRNDKERARHTALIGLYSGTLAAAGVLFVRLLTGPAEHDLFRYDYFSYFQPAYILALACAAFLLSMVVTRITSRKRLFAALAFFIVALGATPAVFSPVWKNVLNAASFLTAKDPWFQSIDELHPMFSPVMFTGRLAVVLPNAALLFGALIPVLLLTAELSGCTVGMPEKRERYGRENLFLYLFLSSFFAVFSLYQKRWNNAYAPFLATGIVVFIQCFLRGLDRRFAKKIVPRVAAFLLSVALIAPYYRGTREILTEKYPLSAGLYSSLLWIRANTPATSFLWTPDKKPEYGVFAFWDIGHYVQYFAERPSLSNNFGHHLRGREFYDSLNAWKTADAATLEEFLTERNVRYLIIGDSDGSGAMGAGELNSYFKRGLVRLREFDGGFSSFGPALGRFRLVYESGNDSGTGYHLAKVKEYKVFEFVRGTDLRVAAAPGEVVSVEGRFETAGKRAFTWLTRGTAGADGVFSCRLPYATKEGNYTVRGLSPYSITTAGRKLTVDVSGKDVVEGGVVTIGGWR